MGGSGNVSESSGSIVTGCFESQEHIKWNIVKGNYEVDESLIGDSCRDLISQVGVFISRVGARRGDNEVKSICYFIAPVNTMRKTFPHFYVEFRHEAATS